MQKSMTFMALIFALTGMSLANAAYGCTDFLISTADGAKIVGRSMEWGADLKSTIWASSRKQPRTSTTPNNTPGLAWSSKYGYVYVDANNMSIAVDGMNEAGLSVGHLWLPGTKYQTVSQGQEKSALCLIDLGHWILGNFSSVEDVKDAIKSVRVWAPSMPSWGGVPTAHLAIHDRSGKSIVVEFIDGEQRIYENKIGVLTNAPTFDWHVTNLRNYVHISAANAQPLRIKDTVLSPPGQGGGFLGIPGDWTPPSRFVRTSAMLNFAKQPENKIEGVSLAEHVLNAVDIPVGAVRTADNGLEHSDYTQWIVIKDLTNGVLYFRSYDNLTLRAIDLKRLDFANGADRNLTAIAGGAPFTDITPGTK